MADDEAKVLAAAKKLPLDEQLGHSNWKVRSQALESIKEACGRAFSSEDPIFGEAGASPVAAMRAAHPAINLSVRHSVGLLLLLPCACGVGVQGARHGCCSRCLLSAH